MKRFELYLILVGVVFMPSCSQLGSQNETRSIVWDVDNLESIGGYEITVLGTPQVIETSDGKALEFNGAGDGLIIEALPLAGAEAFTLEIIFRPDPGGLAAPRLLHMQEQGSKHRVLIETRLTDDGLWYLDTYVNSAKDSHTIIDTQKTHPMGEWYNATLVCSGWQMRHYVNGVEEMSAPLVLAPLGNGKTSIGVRMNKICWFKGAIRKIRFTPNVIRPEKFLKP